MRICLQSMTKLLPAILIAAMAVSVQAQSIENGSASMRDAAQSYQQQESFPQLQVAASEFEQGIFSGVVQVANNMPQVDNSTSPRKLSPQINSAAFQSSAIETPNVEARTEMAFVSHPQTDNNFTPYPRNVSAFDVSPQSQPIADMSYANRSEYGRGAIALGSGTTFQKLNYVAGYSRSPFPVGPDDCCDEWSNFCGPCSSDTCGCAGLKANPGHLGLKWLKGKDACEKTPCRGRCKRNGESECNSCETECGCNDESGRSGIIKAHCTKKSNRNSTCGCSDCRTGAGLFSR